MSAGGRRTALLCALAALVCACGPRRGPVPLVMFHAVVESPGPNELAPARFAALLDGLEAAGFRTVSLGEALDAEDRGLKLAGKPVVLTFDDGTEDAFTTVLPLLRARGQVATFFLVSAWTARDASARHVEATPDGPRPALVWPEVLALRHAGMEVGSHSRTHARFGEVSDAQARAELAESKRALEQGLGAPVTLFAYPFNSLRARHRALVTEAGYRAALAGPVHGGGDRRSLFRVGVYRETSPAELVQWLGEWERRR